jgi:hypothetical protein
MPQVVKSRAALQQYGYRLYEANIDDSVDVAKIPNKE